MAGAKKPTRKAAPQSAERSLTTNEQRAVTLLAEVAARASLAARFGKSFGDDRDIYEALGYTKNPSFNDFYAKYVRQEVAKTLIDAPVTACWRKPPRIVESSEKVETPFEAAWNALVKRLPLWGHIGRAEKLARIGNYSVLFLGLSGSADFEQEATGTNELLYLTPFSQKSADILAYETDGSNERFGQPISYKITMANAQGKDDVKTIHWTRVIHIAEERLESEVLGTPQLESVLNRLQDLDMIVGGGAEMFWRGAFPGWAFSKQADANWEGQSKEELNTEIEKFVHKLTRILKVEGVDVKSLAQQIADPSNMVNVLLDLISAGKRMPKRILTGSERGQLASDQDEKHWSDTIQGRQAQHCEPYVLRPLIDRLILVGVLPAPAKQYTVEWPDLQVPNAKEGAEIGKIKSDTIKNYASTPGADVIIPPEVFLRDILGMSEDKVEEIITIIGATVDADLDEIDKAGDQQTDSTVTGTETEG